MIKTYLKILGAIVVLGASVAACGDGGGTSTGSTASTGGGGTTSTTGTAGSGGETTSMTGTAGSGGGTGGIGGTTSATGGGGTGGTMTGGGGSTSTGGGGPTTGYCTKPCGTVADCCPAGSMDCPSNMYPNNYQCKNNACYSPECMSTADCTAVDPSQDCLSLSGFNTCVIACTADAECTAPATCIGEDDNGMKYCTVAGGGCTDDASCNGFGKCIDKVCVCEMDSDCTFQGFTKCAL